MEIGKDYQYTPIQYVSQYVPIPFDDLMKVADKYQQRIDNAYKTMADALKEWSAFRSPSQVDTQRYYDLTSRGAKEMIDRFSSNPDLIKDPESWRKIDNYINSRDYAALSMLKESAEHMRERQKYNQDLAKNGLYNEDFHGINFTNYDTLNPNQGIFSDVSPVSYKSVREIVEPYVNNLKDHFIQQKGGYDYYGVTKQDTENQINDHLSDIFSVPQISKYIDVLQTKHGLSRDEAVDRVRNEIFTAGREYARVNRKVNDFSLKAFESAHGSKSGNDTTKNGPTLLTTQLLVDGMKAPVLNQLKPEVQQSIVDINKKNVTRKKELAKTVADANKKISDAFAKNAGDVIINNLRQKRDAAIKEYNAIKNQEKDSPIRDYIIGDVTRTKDKNVVNFQYGNADKLYAAIDRYDNIFALPTDETTRNATQKVLPGLSDVEASYKGIGKVKLVDLSNKYMLPSEYYSRALHGIASPLTKAGEKFKQALNNKMFTQVPVISQDALYSDANGGIPTGAQKTSFLIPLEQMEKVGLGDAKSLRQLGATVFSGDKQYSSTEDLKEFFVQRGDEVKKKKQTSGESNTVSKGQDYVRVQLVSTFPLEGRLAQTINNDALQQEMESATAIAKQYPRTQNISKSDF